MIGISNERLKHSLEVARMMKEMSEEAGWPESKCQEMFLLGYIHDVGYEFVENQCDHAEIGGEMLRAHGYKYWREVSLHGKVNCDYESEELRMLNIADMTVDSYGIRGGAEKRLEDIANRYGAESKQYMDAKQLAKQIGLCE